MGSKLFIFILIFILGIFSLSFGIYLISTHDPSIDTSKYSGDDIRKGPLGGLFPIFVSLLLFIFSALFFVWDKAENSHPTKLNGYD